MKRILDTFTATSLIVLILSMITVTITGGGEWKGGLNLETLWFVAFIGSLLYQIILYFYLNSFLEQTNLTRLKPILNLKEMRKEWKKMKQIPVFGTSLFYYKWFRKTL